MKVSILSSLSLLACSVAAVANIHASRPGVLQIPLDESDFSVLAVVDEPVKTTGDGYFIQQLDHTDPSKGTFKQHVWWNSQYWKGPGSPVILFTPGETAAGPYGAYLTNKTINGEYAQKLGAAILMVEHRYYGDSSPYTELNAETLQLLKFDQAIQDFVLIAKTIDLPFDTNHSSNADKAPWIMVGGSYSGALSAWTESIAPGTFWAYHASSAPVEAISDFWQYFVPVQNGMPKNCSADIDRVVSHMDKVFTTGTAQEQLELKKMFGLESLEHAEDVMAMLINGPWLWQSNSFTTGYSAFYQFCDQIENVQPGAAVVPDENGVGLDKALAAYANWMNETEIPGYCQTYGYTGERETECMDTWNPNNKIFTDRSVNNSALLQWQWALCDEPFGWWQDGGPQIRPTLASRLIKPPYWTRQCDLYFPTVNGFTYGSRNPSVNEHAVNKHTKGWRLDDTTRLFYVNGEFDPWRTAGVSSEYRTGGALQSTAQVPIEVLPAGIHCSDLSRRNWLANDKVAASVSKIVAQMVEWVGQYPKKS